MKGHERVISLLNEAIRLELTGICQHITQKGMQKHWGSECLAGDLYRTAREKIHRLDALLARILVLGGTPEVDRIDSIRVGGATREQLGNNIGNGVETANFYDQAVAACRQLGDDKSSELFGSLYREEIASLKYYETQLAITSQTEKLEVRKASVNA